MGKLFEFSLSSSESRQPGHKIVKRTRQFIHRKTSKFTKHAYYFQHTRPPSFYQSLFSASSSNATLPQNDNNSDSDNNITTDECYIQFRQAYTQFISLNGFDTTEPRSWKEAFLGLDPPLSLNPAQLQFQELLYEVILTEKTYVHDLALAYKIFAEDALTWPDLPQPLRLIFDNLIQIIRLHLGLVDDLKRRQTDQHPIIRTIADLFLSYTPRFLDYYSAYFVHFETANDVVVRSMASQADPLGIYLKTRSCWPECRNLTLQSFLLKPVQRLMKYPLFFKSLLDALPTKDPDRIDHLRTLHELRAVIHRIELDKKDHEDLRKLEDLGSRITGLIEPLTHPNRRLVYEGPLILLPATLQRSITKDALGSQQYAYIPTLSRSFSSSSLASSTSSSSTKNKLYVFLFNDMILCTKIRSKPRVLTEPVKPGTTYGPSSHSQFKLLHPPGQVTFIDRAVYSHLSSSSSSSSSSSFLSFRRSPICPSMEEHPQQFICSIATPLITTYHFESPTDTKSAWCDALESILESHAKGWHCSTTNTTNTTAAATTTMVAKPPPPPCPPFDPMSVFTPTSEPFTSWDHKPLPLLNPSMDSFDTTLHFTTAASSPIP